MKKIFEVKTDLTTEKNAEFLTSLGEQDRQEIIELDLDLGVDVVKDNLITSYLVCNDLNIEKMKDVLKKHGIQYEVEDVTSQVVSDALKIEDLSGEDLLEKFDPEYVREA
jgi:hypothetical protein